MPWTIVKKDDQFCVYKTQDGEPVGEALGCHDTRDEAEDQLAALYANEPAARASLLRRIWDALRGALGVERKIKDVSEWDGSPSRWPDTESYCADCLIDVNAAAGRDEKAQSHCMLPIREPGDSSDTFVRQAVHAAAGGHGLTRVKRPDDVPEEAWNAAVKAAANKLIQAYNEMEETAPDSIYELAGKKPPEQRALSLSQIGERILVQLMESDSMAWLHDFYVDDGQVIALLSREGRLYRAPVLVQGTEVALGDWVEIEMELAPAERARVRVIRQADGGYRWFARACTAVINRVGEIDSTALFDSFLAGVESHGYPRLLFYHDPRLRMGQADWLAREDNVLLASGLLDDGPLARAFIRAIEEDRGEWGVSIGYTPTEPPAMLEIAPGVTIPVFESGVLEEMSIAPEAECAAWYTNVRATEVRRMNAEVKKALVALFGDEAQAEEFIQSVDETNEEIRQRGLITRDVTGTTEDEQPNTCDAVPEGEDAAPEASVDEIVLTDDAMQRIVERVAAALPQQEPVDLSPLQEALSRLDGRVAALERAEEEKRGEWIRDLPARRRVEVTYRPRDRAGEQDAGTEPASLEEVAQGTLSQLPPRRVVAK